MTGSEPTQLIRIGYWAYRSSMAAGPIDESWPDAKEFVDEGWDAEERPGPAGHLDREDVAGFLERGFVARAYMGLSPCRLCLQMNGALELTDGHFIWPEGLAHYVRHHAVRLPDRFLEHIAGFTDRVEAADLDESWWRSFTDFGRSGESASS